MKTAAKTLTTLVLLGVVATLPVQAAPVRIEIRGCMNETQVHPPASFNEDIVKRGDLVVASFLVDSENFQEPEINIPTRGYVIDPASYTLTFYAATGPVVEPLLVPYQARPISSSGTTTRSLMASSFRRTTSASPKTTCCSPSSALSAYFSRASRPAIPGTRFTRSTSTMPSGPTVTSGCRDSFSR